MMKSTMMANRYTVPGIQAGTSVVFLAWQLLCQF